MKTFSLTILFFAFSFLAGAQSGNKTRDRQPKSDTLSKDVITIPDKNYYLDRSFSRPPYAMIDTINPEQYFPGSKKYYSKRPLNKGGYYHSFALPPDTSSKYYLIIKDPLTNKVTR